MTTPSLSSSSYSTNSLSSCSTSSSVITTSPGDNPDSKIQNTAKKIVRFCGTCGIIDFPKEFIKTKRKYYFDGHPDRFELWLIDGTKSSGKLIRKFIDHNEEDNIIATVENDNLAEMKTQPCDHQLPEYAKRIKEKYDSGKGYLVGRGCNLQENSILYSEDDESNNRIQYYRIKNCFSKVQEKKRSYCAVQ